MQLTEAELKLANLDNLTRLWQAMGAEREILSSQNQVFLSPGWPYRFWGENVVTSPGEQVSPALINRLANLPGNTVIPVWPQVEAVHKSLEQALTGNGYSPSFELLAMGLVVSQEMEQAGDNKEGAGLRLVNCSHHDEVNGWTRVCSEAFGYEIDPKVIQGLAHDNNVRLILGYENQQAVATALLFNSQYQGLRVTGLHQFGVPAKYRGRGIARQLMSALLAQNAGDTDFISLQASAMGKGLYAGFGFKEQFLIRNYRRN